MSSQPIVGLTAEQVEERYRLGQSNRPSRFDRLQYAQIVIGNIVTLFNATVVPAAMVLLVLNDFRGAIAVSGMAIVNSSIGLFQEIVTKRRLEKLVTLAEPKVRVLRDGGKQEISSSQVVLGDYLLLTAGTIVVADGPVLEANCLEIDEALLTGESDPVRRQVGDRLLSGSFCAAGDGIYRVESIGDKTYRSRIASEARNYRYLTSPLTRSINRLIKWLSVTAISLAVLSVGLYVFHHLTTTQSAQMVAATITSIIPQGMVLMATVAFTLSAVRSARRGAHFQRLNAVEAMSSVDVLCMDKTGTVTTNRLRFEQLHVLAGDLAETEVRKRLSLFASVSDKHPDRLLQAMQQGLTKVEAVLLDQIPFQARNRYSAVRVRDGISEHTLVLGAYEALSGQLEITNDAKWESAWKELLPSGSRILLFAEVRQSVSLTENLEGVRLHPLAFVSFSDEIRPGVETVLANMAAQGIVLKFLSGDNPETVKATVGRVWAPLRESPVLSGKELEAAADATELILNRSVFGRVSPNQKALIIRTLQKAGHHVAMIGDGINDALAIKLADLGIALGDGSQTSKAVAGLVLANNDFALLPEILEESRVVVRNIRCSCKMFLVKNVYSFLMLVFLFPGLLGLHYPFLPQQVTLLNLLSIGLPAFLIALNRRPTSGDSQNSFLHDVGWFALRTGVLFAAAGILVLWQSVHEWREDLQTQRTVLLTALILLGLTGMIRASNDGESSTRLAEMKFFLLALVCISIYVAIMFWPPSANFFQLTSLSLWQWIRTVVVVVPVIAFSVLTDHIRIPFVERRINQPN